MVFAPPNSFGQCFIWYAVPLLAFLPLYCVEVIVPDAGTLFGVKVLFVMGPAVLQEAGGEDGLVYCRQGGF